MLRRIIVLIIITLLSFMFTETVDAYSGIYDKVSHQFSIKNNSLRNQARYNLYIKIARKTGVPWYYLAAVNEYERGLHAFATKKRYEQVDSLISIHIPDYLWCGIGNVNFSDRYPFTITLFGGIGKDGNGDGKADVTNGDDALFTMAKYMSQKGKTEDDIRNQLWRYYAQQSYAVDSITHMAKIYAHFHSLELNQYKFPIPLNFNYDYKNTWGASRGYGGARAHEGTDIFAATGTPVYSTCYGYVELKGWNRLGGWRLGIRDAAGRYHYFGHLSRYKKDINIASFVIPGEVIGYVGSTGYGKRPGTAGKFPSHLHYGLYRFNGNYNYAFNPYSFLKNWEQAARADRKRTQGW